MGFYSPHTIVRDAVRHGVQVLGPCIERSRRNCTLEPRTADAGPIGHPRPGWPADPSTHAVRVGLRYVRGLPDALLDRIDAERAECEFTDLEDFTRRTGAPVDALESLATAGAFACLRRHASRRAVGGGRAARRASATPGCEELHTLPGIVTGVEAPPLPGMTDVEETAADLWAVGLSADRHPTEFVRARLNARGAVTVEALRSLPDRTVVEVGGVVTHRQQPETANGIVFLNLEDETGLVNIICTPDVWKRFRKVARTSPALCVRGLLECRYNVINVMARRIEPLGLGVADVLRSRDFR